MHCRVAGGSTKFCAAQQLLQFQTPCENWCAPLMHRLLDVPASLYTLEMHISALSGEWLQAEICLQ